MTGAAGFIGSHLCRRLVGEGYEVVGFDDLSAGRLENLHDVPSVRFEEGDLRDAASVARASDGCDVIFHQAAMKSVPRSIEDPAGFTAVNVVGTLHVLLAARDAGAAVVSASSASVYGDQDRFPLTEDMDPRPRSPYAASKLAGEGYCRAFWESYGVPAISLRYLNVYGPGQDPRSQYAAVVPRFVMACLTGTRPVIYGDGEQVRDFTFVDDVVEANLLASRMPEAAKGRVINVAGGRPPMSVNGLLAAVARAAGTTPDPIHEPPRAGDIRRSQADITMARTLLGFEPTIDVDEGVRRTVAWFGDPLRRERVTGIEPA